jgi:DNA-binding beta-propeller fold protein YncE
VGRCGRSRPFGGFDRPHIVAISPDAQYAYITDDTRGTLTAIRLSDMKVTSTISVGAGAHHLAFSPNERQAWVALGEAARTITLISTVVRTPPPPSSPVGDPGHPHVIGQFTPGFPAHDLAFRPDGRGYGSTIEKVDDATGHVITRTAAPYGSVELAAADGYVATASLLRGTLAIYTPNLKLLHVVKLAPATRAVAISRP